MGNADLNSNLDRGCYVTEPVACDSSPERASRLTSSSIYACIRLSHRVGAQGNMRFTVSALGGGMLKHSRGEVAH